MKIVFAIDTSGFMGKCFSIVRESILNQIVSSNKPTQLGIVLYKGDKAYEHSENSLENIEFGDGNLLFNNLAGGIGMCVEKHPQINHLIIVACTRPTAAHQINENADPQLGKPAGMDLDQLADVLASRQVRVTLVSVRPSLSPIKEFIGKINKTRVYSISGFEVSLAEGLKLPQESNKRVATYTPDVKSVSGPGVSTAASSTTTSTSAAAKRAKGSTPAHMPQQHVQTSAATPTSVAATASLIQRLQNQQSQLIAQNQASVSAAQASMSSAVSQTQMASKNMIAHTAAQVAQQQRMAAAAAAAFQQQHQQQQNTQQVNSSVFWNGQISWHGADPSSGQPVELCCDVAAQIVTTKILNSRAEDFYSSLWPKKLKISSTHPGSFDGLQKLAVNHQAIPVMELSAAAPNPATTDQNTLIFQNLVNILTSKSLIAMIRFGESNPSDKPGLAITQGIVLAPRMNRLIAFGFFNVPLSLVNQTNVGATISQQQQQQQVQIQNLTAQQQMYLQQQAAAAQQHQLGLAGLQSQQLANLYPQQQQQQQLTAQQQMLLLQQHQQRLNQQQAGAPITQQTLQKLTPQQQMQLIQMQQHQQNMRK